MKRQKARLTVVVNSIVRSQPVDERCVVVRTLRDPRLVFSLTSWAEHMKLPSLNFRFKRNLVEVRHAFEGMKTIVNFCVRKTFDSFSAKLLHVERCHHRSEDHRSPHRAFVELL